LADWKNKATRMAIDAIRNEAIDECADLLRTRALITGDQDIANIIARLADDLDELKAVFGTGKL
jgi:hypothetical protein